MMRHDDDPTRYTEAEVIAFLREKAPEVEAANLRADIAAFELLSALDDAILIAGRPDGQPGTVRGAWTYPAIRLHDGTVVHWRDTTTSAGRWVDATGELAASFEPGLEFQADCPHVEDGAPWRCCDREADCLARIREGR